MFAADLKINMATSGQDISPTDQQLLLSSPMLDQPGIPTVPSIKGTLWDPLLSKDWDKEAPSSQCLTRIKRCSKRKPANKALFTF